MFEELESRLALSVSVATDAAVLAVFNDSNATSDTTYTVTSTNSDIQGTVLKTTLLRMQVHTVNSDGSIGTKGEMDFLLLDSYAKNNIAHIESLIADKFYDGLTFHRVLQDFMIQGGDPLGTGSGGSGADGGKGSVQDDEFSTDIRFTSTGLLALANSGVDTNDCQFFITAGSYRSGDFQYTIIGDLVAGDDIRQAIANVPVEDNGSSETSKPVNSPIIDSITIDTTDNHYGLVLLKTTSSTTGTSGTISVTASAGSTVTMTDSDESTGHASLTVAVAASEASTEDRPAYIEQTMPDVTTTVDTAVTFSIPVDQGDSGVSLTYGAAVVSDTTDLTCSADSGGGASATATPSNGIVGVYSLIVGVARSSSDSSTNTDYDTQHIALYVKPSAPTGLEITTPGVSLGTTTSINNGLSFEVDGVTSGMTVAIFADGGDTPIGTAVATGTTVTVVTTVALSDGDHSFTAKQDYKYSDTVVGNRTISAGDLYSDATASLSTLTIDSPPTAVALLSDVKKVDSPTASVTFTVTYSNPGDTVLISTIGSNNILVTNTNGFSQLASFVSATPDSDAATIVATYQISAPGDVWDANSLVRYTLTMQQNQVSDSNANYVVSGVLLTFNPSDTIPPTVTIEQATGQTDPTKTSPVLFTATFSEAVSGFSASDVTISGTAGATTATITPVGSDGTTYTVSISGMTDDGTIIVSLAAGAAEDSVGNASEASTSTDNSVTYTGFPLLVTINQASSQADPTTKSPIHFTVVFNKAVSDFAAADITFGGTVLGKLVATITDSGDGMTYDVSVTGMASTGKLTLSVAAGVAESSAGVSNSASTSTDNSVQFNLTALPTFRLTAPNSGTYTVGQTVVIAWSDTNIISGTTISLCYDTIPYNTDKVVGGKAHWIEVDAQSAANGSSTYSWDTTGVAPGTYYIGGYLYSGKAIRSYIATSITIKAAAAPTLHFTSPASGKYNVGTQIVVAWTASNMASDATVSLFYDSDTKINGNEKYVEVDGVDANNLQKGNYGGYQWDTTGMKAGTYYIGGYLWSNGKATWSHLTTSITLVVPAASFRITSPTSGSYVPGEEVSVYWIADNFASGSTVNLCYDSDTKLNGNEHYFEVGQVTAANSGGYSSYTWTIPDLAPGKYYIGGYLWSNGKATWSHLGQPITITAALTVDASTPASGDAATLTEAQLQPIIAEAERRLTAATGIQVAAALSSVSIEIGNLPKNVLGEVEGNVIEISSTAAGYGWFVDSTPADDSEFSDRLGTNALGASSGSPAANHVDLLTTVMHEMLHLLGYGHDDSLDLMNSTLSLGERRSLDDSSPSSLSSQNGVASSASAPAATSAVDQVFASSGDARNWAST